MNLKLTFVLHLIGISILVIKTDGLRCYVCSDEDDEDPSCKDFDLKKETYVIECPSPNNKGCEKHSKGHKFVRKCSSRSINDCQQANEVEYCYCMTDLCNSNISKLSGPTDDEDLIEGSGTTKVSSGTEKSLVVVKDKSLGSKVDLYCFFVLAPVVIVMFYNN